MLVQSQSLDWEDPLEKEIATYSSILAWEIQWTEKPVRATVHGIAESDMTEHACTNTHTQKRIVIFLLSIHLLLKLFFEHMCIV